MFACLFRSNKLIRVKFRMPVGAGCDSATSRSFVRPFNRPEFWHANHIMFQDRADSICVQGNNKKPLTPMVRVTAKQRYFNRRGPETDTTRDFKDPCNSAFVCPPLAHYHDTSYLIAFLPVPPPFHYGLYWAGICAVKQVLCVCIRIVSLCLCVSSKILVERHIVQSLFSKLIFFCRTRSVRRLLCHTESLCPNTSHLASGEDEASISSHSN